MKTGVLILLLLLPVLAQPQFDKFHIITDVGLSHVSEQIEVTILNKGEENLTNFNYTLAHDPGPVYAEVDGKRVEPRIIINHNTWTLDLDLNVGPKEKSTILFRFRADPLVKSSEEGRNFQFTFSPEYLTRDFTLRVVLPSGAILAEKRAAAQTQPVVFPDAAVSTDGRQITVELNLGNFQEDKIFLINYEMPISTPTEVTNYQWGLLIVLFVVVLVLYSTQVQWKSTLQALDEDEKKVMNEIRKKPGIPQRDISKITGFTKVKVFRVVQRLSRSNLVRIEKRANRTRLHLSEKLEGVLNPLNSFKSFFLNLKQNLIPNK
jgi:uncharacterized membrane protein